MTRMTRVVLAGALAGAFGLAVPGCGPKGGSVPTVSKAQTDDAVKRMKEGQSKGEKADDKAKDEEKGKTEDKVKGDDKGKTEDKAKGDDKGKADDKAKGGDKGKADKEKGDKE